MHRIAASLAGNGFKVLLVGRKLKASVPLAKKSFGQKRITCFFANGFLFYLEYNLRLFVFLLFKKSDIVCAIDLDTILPVYFVSFLKKQKRVYDAHELFTEQKEVIARRWIHACWLCVEKFAVPKFRLGYTVNDFIAAEFDKRYAVQYKVIRNLPILTPLPDKGKREDKWILYQGAVNEGRCFETLVPAMKQVNTKLVICGKGNFYEQAQALVKQYQLEAKIEFRGYMEPVALNQLTPTAYIGLTLFESNGMNQYYSLANRFFDYMMAGVPQVCMNYPEYAAINHIYGFAYLINDAEHATIADALNNLLVNDVVYEQLRRNCIKARNLLNWQNEERILLDFYKALS
jgi:glycosyltransferase involved in cell wall biosynthesis